MRSRVGIAAVVVVLSLGFASHAHADDPLYACYVPPAGTKVSVSFAPDTSVRDLAVWVSGFTCKNVVFGAELARCAARVDIISPVEMTPKQALALFVDSLDAVGLKATIKADTIIIKAGPDSARECNALAPVAAVVAPAAPDPSAAVDADGVDLSGATSIDDTHATVTRALVDRLRADHSLILKASRIVPWVQDGKLVGFKLYAIRPTSILARVGLANGDSVVGVSGTPAVDADKTAAALEKAARGDQLVLDLVRRGNRTELTITVVP
jgi:hypothetical protein